MNWYPCQWKIITTLAPPYDRPPYQYKAAWHRLTMSPDRLTIIKREGGHMEGPGL